MREALAEAAKGARAGEVPVGAVMVMGGRVVARAHNETEQTNDPTAHAEMLCIRQAARVSGGWRLQDATLYVTLEPCPMCAGAALQARVGTVVYGAPNPMLGADGGWVQLLPPWQNATATSNGFGTTSDSEDGGPLLRPHAFNPNMTVVRGVLQQQCTDIMISFFRQRRQEAVDAEER